MKVFIPAYFVTSGHSVQKWKGKGNEQKRCEETTACCYLLSVKLDAPAPCRLDAPDLDLICYASADCLHQHLQVI